MPAPSGARRPGPETTRSSAKTRRFVCSSGSPFEYRSLYAIPCCRPDKLIVICPAISDPAFQITSTTCPAPSYQATARSRQERVVASGVLPGASCARSIRTGRMVWRGRRHGAALRAGAGRFRVDNLGICRDRLPARHRGTKHLRARPAVARQADRLSGIQKRKKARRPFGHRAGMRSDNYLES